MTIFIVISSIEAGKKLTLRPKFILIIARIKIYLIALRHQFLTLYEFYNIL